MLGKFVKSILSRTCSPHRPVRNICTYMERKNPSGFPMSLFKAVLFATKPPSLVCFQKSCAGQTQMMKQPAGAESTCSMWTAGWRSDSSTLGSRPQHAPVHVQDRKSHVSCRDACSTTSWCTKAVYVWYSLPSADFFTF